MDRPNLPVELLCQVLYLLDVHDLLTCTLINRFFRALVRESSRLQYTLELAKHRMISLRPPAEFPPYSTRLKLIRDREHNWRSPQNWGPLTSLNLPPTGTVYEFVGGYYANGWEGENKASSGITIFELPSTEPRLSDEPLKTWTHPLGPIKIADFTMDPAQDLLVLVVLAPPQCDSVYQVLLRSFSTNEPHPDSSQPLGVLSCLPRVTDPIIPHETTGAVRVQVAGDLVALLVKEVHDSVSAHLQIWNWRYGSHYSCAMARMAGIEDFTFLSDNTFLIVRPSGRFECYTFENPISGNTSPTLKSSYGLPPLQDGYMYWYICMSSNPAPGYVPRTEGTGNRVYYPQPAERIHACCLYIFKPTGVGDHHVHSFVFFLNVKMFLDPPAPRPRDNYPLAPYCRSDSRMADAALLASQTEAGLVQSSQAPVLPTTTAFDLPPPLPIFPQPSPAAISRSRQMHLRSLLLSSNVQTIPWEVWGPQNTRWFDEALSTDWQHALYGLRTAECIDPARPKVGRPVPLARRAADEYESADEDGDEVELGAPRVDMANLPTVNDLLNGIGFDPVEGDDDAGAVAAAATVHPTGTAGVNVASGIRVPPLRAALRHVRIRDYNPSALRPDYEEGEDADGGAPRASTSASASAHVGKGKAREQQPQPQPRRKWARRLVTTPSVTPSRGVFAKDIVSALPYSEVVSRAKYNVTDVMMDDSRVLLMQRGKGGRLKGIDVLAL